MDKENSKDNLNENSFLSNNMDGNSNLEENVFNQNNNNNNNNLIIDSIIETNKILLSEKTNFKFGILCDLLEKCVKQKSKVKSQ